MVDDTVRSSAVANRVWRVLGRAQIVIAIVAEERRSYS